MGYGNTTSPVTYYVSPRPPQPPRLSYEECEAAGLGWASGLRGLAGFALGVFYVPSRFFCGRTCPGYAERTRFGLRGLWGLVWEPLV